MFIYPYSYLSARGRLAPQGVGLVRGQDPELVDAIDEAVSSTHGHVVGPLDMEVGAVEREGEEPIGGILNWFFRCSMNVGKG